jgi:hypothetical protein
MKWPWVSRRAYDAVVDQKDVLLDQNSKLIEHLSRKSRFEAGMSETPRPPPKMREPMPEVLRDNIAGGSDSSMRRMRRTELERRYSRGESWDAIVDDVLGPPLEEPSLTSEPYAAKTK